MPRRLARHRRKTSDVAQSVREPELVRRLLDDYEHLVDMILTSPEIPYLVRALDAVEQRAAVHVRGPMHALTALALGAPGATSP